MSNLNGVICPAITFFNKNFEVNMELNSLLYRHIHLNEANAILLFGTTGEGQYFMQNTRAKIKLIDLAYDITEESIPILSGVFGDNPDDILDEMDILGKKYKDLIFVIPPPISKTEDEISLKSYFNNILESTNQKNKVIIYNNPNIFANNSITPQLLSELLTSPNLIGIKDSSEKIGNYKSYIQNVSEDFMVGCGKERKFSYFLQLFPPEKRKNSALIPSLSNLVNIPLKLYNAALEENPLEIEKYQDDINEFREKIFDTQNNVGKQQRGLKHALYALYRDSLETPLEEGTIVSSEYQKNVEKFTLDRIQATVNYLLNLEYIDRLYPVSQNYYNLNQLRTVFSIKEGLKELGLLKKIKGPYGRKREISTIYRMKFDQDLVARFQDFKSFRSDDICREKVLFPFLDGTLNKDKPELRSFIKEIVSTKKGHYIFENDKAPTLPVANLIHFDETKELFPCNYTIQEYIQGKPFYFYLINFKGENLGIEMPKLVSFFKSLGKILGKLHRINFDAFYEQVSDISKHTEKRKWIEIFNTKLDKHTQEAKKNKLDIGKEIKDFFKDNIALIEDEDEAIAIHNDFHGQNIIIKDDGSSIRTNGIINFEKWRVGVRAQDFVKIDYCTLKSFDVPQLYQAFYEGYEKYYGKKVDNDFLKKVEIYKLMWFLREFNKNPENMGLINEMKKIIYS